MGCFKIFVFNILLLRFLWLRFQSCDSSCKLFMYFFFMSSQRVALGLGFLRSFFHEIPIVSFCFHMRKRTTVIDWRKFPRFLTVWCALLALTPVLFMGQLCFVSFLSTQAILSFFQLPINARPKCVELHVILTLTSYTFLPISLDDTTFPHKP